MFDLFSQAPDMDIHSADISGVILSPDHLQEHGTAVDLAGMCRQELQQFKFFTREVDVSVSDHDPAVVLVDA